MPFTAALDGFETGVVSAADAARIVLPHEDVMPGPVRGRRQLMEATQANLEPIFLLYEGSPSQGGQSHGSQSQGGLPAGGPGGGRRAGRGTASGATRIAAQVAGTATPVLSADTRDAKTRLQEWAQSRGKIAAAPIYTLKEQAGPDHAPRFIVKAQVPGFEPVTGEGGSKRQAEQDAATKLLAIVSAKEQS